MFVPDMKRRRKFQRVVAIERGTLGATVIREVSLASAKGGQPKAKRIGTGTLAAVSGFGGVGNLDRHAAKCCGSRERRAGDCEAVCLPPKSTSASR
jgi:hypothetical protein